MAKHSKKRGVGRKPKPVQIPALTAWYDTPQAAMYINVSTQFLEIARHKADGRGPPYVKLDRLVRYRPADLDAWMISHLTDPTTPTSRKRNGRQGQS